MIMRLWHYKLIPYLPKSQLLAQWRELNSIFKKQDKHILINYIYDYDKEYLRTYSLDVINEMTERFNTSVSVHNMIEYFGKSTFAECDKTKRFPEHNDNYARQCFYNLQEKYERGQKEFSDECYSRLRRAFLRILAKEE